MNICQPPQSTSSSSEIEQHYRRLSATIPAMLYDYVLYPDGTNKFVYVGPKCSELLELSENELLADSGFFWRLVHADDLQRLKDDDVVANRYGKFFSAEVRIVTPSGKLKWIQLSSQPNPVSLEEPAIWSGIMLDITERKQAELELSKSLSLLNATIESTNDAILVVDMNNNWVLHNNKFAELWQIPDDIITSKNDTAALTFVLDQLKDAGAFLHKVMALYSTPDASSFDTIEFNDGKIIERHSKPQYIDNVVAGRVWSFHDVTARKSAEIEMQIAATAFESHEGLMVTDATGSILRVNQAFSRITGYSIAEVKGKKPNILRSGRHNDTFYQRMWKCIETTNTWSGEVWNKRKSGEIYPEHLIISAIKDDRGKTINYVAALSDITLSRDATDEIKHLAFYDALTRLPNRKLMLDRLHQAMSSSLRNNNENALLIIDLDNFKALNDVHGHDVGDLLLQQVAQRLESCVREGDTVARMGGDEFAVILEDLSGDVLSAAEQAEAIGNKILHSLNQPYQLSTHEHHNTPSIGIMLFKGHLLSSDEVIKQADIAMYQAKKAGRNSIRFFDPQMQRSINARASLEGDLRNALLNKQFILYYQPQVDCDRKVVGAEALIRWIHPDRGMVSPSEFIPISEETGLILPIGHWVLETACIQLAIWASEPLMAQLTVAVNVSAQQFQQNDFVSQVQDVLQRTGANPQRLKLELTESMLLQDIEGIIVKMTTLKSAGVSFSLDDFGTGYSSLSYLSRLPLDLLKIDQSFVANLESSDNAVAICAATISLAHSLKLKVVAEGVESETQSYILCMGHHCDYMQGYLFDRPLPVALFETSVRRIP
ncbi:MAG: EAL domain-containing protein [Gallionella sp.]|jgi:diguanylate cyclase (GGDEF)-like protein/PAS domain S-box-containing protein